MGTPRKKKKKAALEGKGVQVPFVQADPSTILFTWGREAKKEGNLVVITKGKKKPRVLSWPPPSGTGSWVKRKQEGKGRPCPPTREHSPFKKSREGSDHTSATEREEGSGSSSQRRIGQPKQGGGRDLEKKREQEKGGLFRGKGKTWPWRLGGVLDLADLQQHSTGKATDLRKLNTRYTDTDWPSAFC